MSSPVLWGPNSTANNLESALGFSNGAGPTVYAPASPVDPTSVATAGNKGDLYVNNSVPAMYQKQDNGTTTNWTLFSMGASIAYSQAFHTQAATWSTSSTTYADPTASGTPALTIRRSSGLALTTAGSSVAGITFTPASSTAVYIITASICLSGPLNAFIDFQLTDGSTVLVQGASEQSNALNHTNALSLTGLYTPGTTSPVTVKFQLATNTGTVSTNFEAGNPIEWTVTQVFAPIVSVPAPPALNVYLSTNTAVTANTVIKFDTTLLDTNAAYSASTGLFTCPSAGIYLVTGSALGLAVNAAVYVKVNGVTMNYVAASNITNVTGGAVVVHCSANDTIGLYIDTTQTMVGGSAPYDTYMCISRLGN